MERELLGERLRQVGVDAFELDAVDHALVDRNLEHARRGIEVSGRPGEREAFVSIQVDDRVDNLVGRGGEGLVDGGGQLLAHRLHRELFGACDLDVLNGGRLGGGSRLLRRQP